MFKMINHVKGILLVHTSCKIDKIAKFNEYKNKKNHEVDAQNMHFQTLEEVLSVAEFKKAVVKDLVKAFVKANVPLEKVNALQPFLKKYCRKGGAIPQAETTDSWAQSVVN